LSIPSEYSLAVGIGKGNVFFKFLKGIHKLVVDYKFPDYRCPIKAISIALVTACFTVQSSATFHPSF